MPTNVVVPSLGESVTEAVLLRWAKNDGDVVAVAETIAELETDKANVDLPSTAAGVLRHAKNPGETVQVGEVVARIDEGGAGAAAPAGNASASKKASAGGSTSAPAASAPAAAATASTSRSEDMRPSVRRIVEENKIDPSKLSGTGPGGKVTKEDATRAAESRGAGPNGGGGDGSNSSAPPRHVVPPAAVTTPPPLAPTREADAHGGFDAHGNKRVAMSKIRKRIAQTLVQAQQTAAILTTFNEVDMSAISALRAKFKERFQEVHGIGLGFMSFFARAVVLAMKEYPRVNAEIDGDDVVYHNYVHLGIAVSTDRGLAVPVLRHAEQMGFAKVESEIKRLANAARDGKLGIQELSGGTFTITNGGVFGSLLSTPILNPPQSGILGMHAIQQRPVAIDGKVEVRPMMYVALSYDHRLVDGRESVSFLVRMKQYLEDPARLMLEI